MVKEEKLCNGQYHLIERIHTDLEEIESRTRLVIGEDNIEKIRSSSVAIVGIGGVGSVVAEQLVRLGIRDIIIVARGNYEFSNINRQIPATYLSVISKIPKVYAMSKRLHEINPFINTHLINCDVKSCIEILSKKFKENNVKFIFNCVDEYLAQLAIADISYKLNTPMIFGGVTKLGVSGIVSIYDPSRSNINYNQIFKFPYVDNKSNIEKIIKKKWLDAHQKEMPVWLRKKYSDNPDLPYPVITPVSWIIASFAVNEFIKLIFNITEPILFPSAIWIDTIENYIKIIDLRESNPADYIPWRP